MRRVRPAHMGRVSTETLLETSVDAAMARSRCSPIRAFVHRASGAHFFSVLLLSLLLATPLTAQGAGKTQTTPQEPGQSQHKGAAELLSCTQEGGIGPIVDVQSCTARAESGHGFSVRRKRWRRRKQRPAVTFVYKVLVRP